MNDREMLVWVMGYIEGSIDEVGLRKDKANVVLDSLQFHMKPNQGQLSNQLCQSEIDRQLREAGNYQHGSTIGKNSIVDNSIKPSIGLPTKCEWGFDRG